MHYIGQRYESGASLNFTFLFNTGLSREVIKQMYNIHVTLQNVVYHRHTQNMLTLGFEKNIDTLGHFVKIVTCFRIAI